MAFAKLYFYLNDSCLNLHIITQAFTNFHTQYTVPNLLRGCSAKSLTRNAFNITKLNV